MTKTGIMLTIVISGCLVAFIIDYLQGGSEWIIWLGIAILGIVSHLVVLHFGAKKIRERKLYKEQ